MTLCAEEVCPAFLGRAARFHWALPDPAAVEGDEAVVESLEGAFEPFPVRYAETFIVPAAVGAYQIRPVAGAPARDLATIKASVRT